MGAGKRAKEIITDSDVKQTVIAQKLGLKDPVLSNYLSENRSMPHDILAALAIELKTTTDYLLGVTSNPECPFELSKSERLLIQEFRSLTDGQKELIAQNILFMKKQNLR